MKKILEFTLPEENKESLRAEMATNLTLVIWEMEQWLRNQIKHYEMDYEKVSERLNEIKSEYSIDLDQLIE